MAFLDPVLNPLLQPLLNTSPFWAVVILAFVITLIITVVYKFFTNQTEMKRLKDEQKEYQKRIKSLKDNKEEMMKVQKEAMKVNGQYMKHSLKATLITFLPIILIFGWMNGHLAYEPIYPGETYSVSALFEEGVEGEVELIPDDGTKLKSEAVQETNKGVIDKLPRGYFSSKEVPATTWQLTSDEGEHFITIKYDDKEFTKKVLITKELQYETPIEMYEHSDLLQMQINYNKLKPLGKQSLFGWQPGWLGLYILLSIVFSISLRKLLKVY